MASETLKEITYDGKKVLTEAAKRDARGRVIDTTYYTKAQVDDKIKNFITTIPDELTPTKITMKDGAGTIEGIKQITNAGGSDGSFDIYCASSTTAGANPFVNFWNGYPATKGARLNLNNLTGQRIFNFPDKDGTLATTDDIPVIKVKMISGSSATSDLQDLWDECGENILPLALYYEWSEDPRVCEAVPFDLRWEHGDGASSSYRLFYLGDLVRVSGQDYYTSRWQEARNTDESSATFYLYYMKVNPQTGK